MIRAAMDWAGDPDVGLPRNPHRNQPPAHEEPYHHREWPNPTVNLAKVRHKKRFAPKGSRGHRRQYHLGRRPRGASAFRSFGFQGSGQFSIGVVIQVSYVTLPSRKGTCSLDARTHHMMFRKSLPAVLQLGRRSVYLYGCANSNISKHT